MALFSVWVSMCKIDFVKLVLVLINCEAKCLFEHIYSKNMNNACFWFLKIYIELKFDHHKKLNVFLSSYLPVPYFYFNLLSD